LLDDAHRGDGLARQDHADAQDEDRGAHRHESRGAADAGACGPTLERAPGVHEREPDACHHRGHPDFIEKVTKINCFHVELFAYFLAKLKATPEGDGNLLDHSSILYGGALSDGNAHSNSDLPLVLAGNAGGRRGGRHIANDAKTPVANLFVSMLNSVGVATESFGDSTGRVELAS